MASDDQQTSGSGIIPAPAPADRCPNCLAPLHGRYCTSCGQDQRSPDRALLTIINEVTEGFFSRDSRPLVTLRQLILHPGLLSLDYFAGRRARYVNPLRLYLFTSLVYFFALSMQSQLAAIDDQERPDTESIEAYNDGVEDMVRAIDIDFLSPEENLRIAQRVGEVGRALGRQAQEDPGDLYEQFVSLIPPVMFFLLPVFALGLKVMYLGSGTYYTEHLVYALHNHCFLFLVLLLSDVAQGLALAGVVPFVFSAISDLLMFWIPVYLYMGMRRFYGERHLLTATKYLLLGVFYWLLFLIGLMVAIATDVAWEVFV